MEFSNRFPLPKESASKQEVDHLVRNMFLNVLFERVCFLVIRFFVLSLVSALCSVFVDLIKRNYSRHHIQPCIREEKCRLTYSEGRR